MLLNVYQIGDLNNIVLEIVQSDLKIQKISLYISKVFKYNSYSLYKKFGRILSSVARITEIVTASFMIG